jgi:hypothetical protein
MDMLVKGMGKHKAAATLDPQDFAAPKKKLARRNGPARMSTLVENPDERAEREKN